MSSFLKDFIDLVPSYSLWVTVPCKKCVHLFQHVEFDIACTYYTRSGSSVSGGAVSVLDYRDVVWNSAWDRLWARKPVGEEKDRRCSKYCFSYLESRERSHGVSPQAKEQDLVWCWSCSTLPYGPLVALSRIWKALSDGPSDTALSYLKFLFSQEIFTPCRAFSCWSGRTEL